MASPKAIVSVINDLYTDQRVHKVCSFLTKQSYDVLLVGRKQKKSKPLEKREYATHRMKLLFEKGAFFYAEYNIRLFFFLLFRKSDLLLSNDLDTLLANFLAKKCKRNTELVYDSHEYFTEVPELIDRPRVQKIWLKIEEWIFPKLKKVYTVNDSIASIYRKKYKQEIRVVRNISKKWTPKNLKSKEELNLPLDKKIIIIQGAGININRGAEEAVEAMHQINALLLIVGDGDIVPQLKEMVSEQNLSEKVRFVGRVPYLEMMNYTYHADIGLTLDKPTSLNYKFSLPNKVFDYMHTQTPIVATNILEVAKVIQKHQIGTILEEFSVDSLAEKINKLLSNEQKLSQYKSNCKVASEIENWEEEENILKEIYLK